MNQEEITSAVLAIWDRAAAHYAAYYADWTIAKLDDRALDALSDRQFSALADYVMVYLGIAREPAETIAVAFNFYAMAYDNLSQRGRRFSVEDSWARVNEADQELGGLSDNDVSPLVLKAIATLRDGKFNM